MDSLSSNWGSGEGLQGGDRQVLSSTALNLCSTVTSPVVNVRLEGLLGFPLEGLQIRDRGEILNPVRVTLNDQIRDSLPVRSRWDLAICRRRTGHDKLRHIIVHPSQGLIRDIDEARQKLAVEEVNIVSEGCDEVVVVDRHAVATNTVEPRCHGAVIGHVAEAASGRSMIIGSPASCLSDALHVKVLLEVAQDDLEAHLHTQESIDTVAPFVTGQVAEGLATLEVPHVLIVLFDVHLEQDGIGRVEGSFLRLSGRHAIDVQKG